MNGSILIIDRGFDLPVDPGLAEETGFWFSVAGVDTPDRITLNLDETGRLFERTYLMGTADELPILPETLERLARKRGESFVANRFGGQHRIADKCVPFPFTGNIRAMASLGSRGTGEIEFEFTFEDGRCSNTRLVRHKPRDPDDPFYL